MNSRRTRVRLVGYGAGLVGGGLIIGLGLLEPPTWLLAVGVALIVLLIIFAIFAVVATMDFPETKTKA